MTETTQHERMIGHLKAGLAALARRNDTTQQQVTAYLDAGYKPLDEQQQAEGDSNAV